MMKSVLTNSSIHTGVHLLFVILFFYVVLFLPLRIVLIIIIAHQIHMCLLGKCILTKIAHNHGVMNGYSYWEYFARILGIRLYKKVAVEIDIFIKVSIVLILIIRFVDFLGLI